MLIILVHQALDILCRCQPRTMLVQFKFHSQKAGFMGEALWQCLEVVLVVLGRQAAVIRLSVAHPCKENHTLCPLVGWQVVVTNQLVVHQEEENLTLFPMVGCKHISVLFVGLCSY